MKYLKPEELQKLKLAMARYTGPTGVVHEQDGRVYVQMGKVPWSALEPFFPKGWTKEEVREALFYELVAKPWHEEIQRRASEMRSPLAGVLK